MSTDDTIKNIITTTIQTKVIEALNDTPEAINKLIAAALNHPVDASTGQTNGYSYNKVNYIDWLIGNELRTAAAQIVREVVKEQGREQLAALIRAKLSSEAVADAFTDAVLGVTDKDWDLNVQFVRKER